MHSSMVSAESRLHFYEKYLAHGIINFTEAKGARENRE